MYFKAFLFILTISVHSGRGAQYGTTARPTTTTSQPTTTTTAQPGAKTTRGWDCCKQSCSWPGKADVSKPVATCAKDGYSVLSDANTVSGCQNGTAFQCNDNVPWAVNDYLAYGFAAANIAGLTEKDCCCACYQLNFTSGPINGKTMVIQVTNTGGDVGENTFDIQMPGSGVGLFDGCSPQWGLPKSAWGDQFGGLKSKNQCSYLPEKLRAGCYFRFDWFKGADNPTVNFAKVTCPAELTSKTGCIRRY